jgi:hypothetical protein
MNGNFGSHGRRFLTLALGLGVMVVGAQSGAEGMRAYAAGGSLRCKIQVEEHGDRIELQGIVFANAEVHGSYELHVIRSGDGGNSNISQAGDFDAKPDAPTPLGIIQLGGDPGKYRARLKVTWNGDAVECEKTVGGWL